MLCGSVYFYVKYVIDKYQVTRQYSKSPIQYGQRSRSTTHLLFNAGYVGQLGNVFYWNYCVPDTYVGIGMWCSLVFAFIAMKVHTRGKRLLPAQLRGNMKLKRLRMLQSMQGSTDYPNSNNSSDDDEPRVRNFEYHPPRPHEMTVGVKVYYENGAAADDDDGEYNLELEPQPEAEGAPWSADSPTFQFHPNAVSRRVMSRAVNNDMSDE